MDTIYIKKTSKKPWIQSIDETAQLCLAYGLHPAFINAALPLKNKLPKTDTQVKRYSREHMNLLLRTYAHIATSTYNQYPASLRKIFVYQQTSINRVKLAESISKQIEKQLNVDRMLQVMQKAYEMKNQKTKIALPAATPNGIKLLLCDMYPEAFETLGKDIPEVRAKLHLKEYLAKLAAKTRDDDHTEKLLPAASFLWKEKTHVAYFLVKGTYALYEPLPNPKWSPDDILTVTQHVLKVYPETGHEFYGRILRSFYGIDCEKKSIPDLKIEEECSKSRVLNIIDLCQKDLKKTIDPMVTRELRYLQERKKTFAKNARTGSIRRRQTAP